MDKQFGCGNGGKLPGFSELIEYLDSTNQAQNNG
jgi:hypothetical protein